MSLVRTVYFAFNDISLAMCLYVLNSYNIGVCVPSASRYGTVSLLFVNCDVYVRLVSLNCVVVCVYVILFA